MSSRDLVLKLYEHFDALKVFNMQFSRGKISAAKFLREAANDIMKTCKALRDSVNDERKTMQLKNKETRETRKMKKSQIAAVDEVKESIPEELDEELDEDLDEEPQEESLQPSKIEVVEKVEKIESKN